ncbi:hypothetical protein DSL72_000410 [Monilinia vaccinii-corymbosi]|uniref:Uncharacterized protein n=1 Tax=Monilinia vaccinii-corymbosi TaxID=61207 RepID=A0A8A3P1J3_9HELO|nr:hypothetical protein DSL72_000410 [Monilinia vaccinii-corymbosi]
MSERDNRDQYESYDSDDVHEVPPESSEEDESIGPPPPPHHHQHQPHPQLSPQPPPPPPPQNQPQSSPPPPPPTPSTPRRKFKVPKFLTEEKSVDLPPNPATTFKGHEQPPVNERLEQIKVFLADEDANRCLDFKDKLKEIQEYLAHIELHNIPRDWRLFKDAKVMTDTQADWHDRMDKTSVGDPLCVDSPQIQPYSTRLMSNEVTLAIRETKELNGTQTQIREDRPPFTVQRTQDHPLFLRSIKADAKKTLTDLTEEEQNQNLFKIESRAYNEAKDAPALIPLWTDPIRGLPNTGKSQSSDDPWYGNGQILGATPKTQAKQEPTHNDLPGVVSGYQSILREYLSLYRENVHSFGRGDQRHAKDWRVAVLKALLRLFPRPEAKALERNANVYSTGQRQGNMTDEEYRAVKDDWKRYNELQDEVLEHLSAQTTSPVQFYYDEPDMVKTDIYDPSKINIPREYGDRLREVLEMQVELIGLLKECRDNGGPQNCNWFILGRMAEILAPVEPDMFGEVGKHWGKFKTRHIPSLWDKAFDSRAKLNWLTARDAEERAVIEPYITELRHHWEIIYKENPDLQREESTLADDAPWIVLLPLQRGALRTDSMRHKMTPDSLQPYTFYVPWATPKPKLSPEMEAQLRRIHRLLREKEVSGGRLPDDRMAALRQNLAPFFYPSLRRMYDQTLSDDIEVRDPALRAFSEIFEPWLAGFEGVGIEIRNYQPDGSQALFHETIPANLTDAPAETKAPQLRQRDPSVLYQTHKRLDPAALDALNAELNRDLPEDGDVGAPPDAGGWSEELKKKYASIIGHPKLKGLRDEIDNVEREINDRGIDDPIVQGFLNKELAILSQNFDVAERQFMMGIRGATKSKSKSKLKTITVLQSVDFVNTDVDTDNIPGVFYLATRPPSPMSIHPEKVNKLSLVPDLDTGIHRNREKNWQQFILGYPEETSRYDNGTLNFQSKAERRGIQRAAIEMALNLLASNCEQRRPDDRFRRVVIPSPWQPPPPEVPISMELEPTKRPVELDPKYYTKLIFQYNRWKDDDWYDARDKIIKRFPGQVAPPANFNGPFTIPTMFEYQDVAAKYLGNLIPTWNALLHTGNVYPRPFLTAVLSRIQRGIDYMPDRRHQPSERIYEEANSTELKLSPQELAVLRELTEPSWNLHWRPYPPVENADEDIPRQILDEFERDIEELPEADKPPYWSSGQPPDLPEGLQFDDDMTAAQRDLRLVTEYHPGTRSVTYKPLKNLLQTINDRRIDQNLPAWDLFTARKHLKTMHQYHHIHFEPIRDEDIQMDGDHEGLAEHVARVALTGHPETKYVERRNLAHLMYGIEYRREGDEDVYTVQYNADRLVGPPIIQPNLYTFIEKAAFRFGRAIAMYTEELTLDEDHYTRALCLDIVNLSYQRTLLRSEGKPLYPGEPNVPPATPNPNDVNLLRIASDLHHVAPDIFTSHGLKPDTLLDASIPLKTRTQYAAQMIQSQVLEELNNNWESRFPVHEKVWGFARDRLINPVQTVVAGRIFTEFHRPRQYFSMRRWPPCEQGPESQRVIGESGPVVQAKTSKEAALQRTIEEEEKFDPSRNPQEAKHIEGAPHFPFGETPYQQAYLSWRIQDDLKDVHEFNPPPPPRSALSKFFPTPSPRPAVDHHELPSIPASFRPRSIPLETLRQRAITKAQATPGLPSRTEYYRESDEANRVRAYRRWVRQNEKIRAIEMLAGGKRWRDMKRDEREMWADQLAFSEMEDLRSLQNAGGSTVGARRARGRGRAGVGAGAGAVGLALRSGQGSRKRSRSRSGSRGERRGGGGGSGSKRRGGSRSTQYQIDPVMSGAL